MELIVRGKQSRVIMRGKGTVDGQCFIGMSSLFHSNVPFLCSLKTSENRSFLMRIETENWQKMG